MRCAARLEQTAQRSDDGYSWRTIESATPHQRNLTGFSHGTAGIAWAMFELAQITGERNFRNTATQALSYERCHFVKDQGNWPDFRENDTPRATDTPNCGVAWCHGAPGIGLSRLRVFELTNDQIAAREAEIAGATTMRYLGMPQTARAGYSLCHGCRRQRRLSARSRACFEKRAFRRTAEDIGRQGIASFEQAALPGRAECWAAAKRPTCCLVRLASACFTCGWISPKFRQS